MNPFTHYFNVLVKSFLPLISLNIRMNSINESNSTFASSSKSWRRVLLIFRLSNQIVDLENQSGETDGGDSTNDANKLRRDMRKLKEYLKTSVQVSLPKNLFDRIQTRFKL